MITNVKQAEAVKLSNDRLDLAIDLIKFGKKSRSRHANRIMMSGFSFIESFNSGLFDVVDISV